MSYTRTQVESELVSRASKKMALVGFAVTTNGSNTYLESPISTALRKMGFTQAGQTVSDADLAALTLAKYDELLDRAELRLLENIYKNIDFTDIDVGPRKEALNQLADQLKDAIATLADRIKAEFGAGASKLGVGSVTHDYAAKGDDDILLPGIGEI